MMARIVLLGMAAAVFALGTTIAAETKENGDSELQELDSVEALKNQFNADSGKRRLLLLLSPT